MEKSSKKPSKGKLWIKENHSPYHGLFFEVNKTLYAEKSPYQKIEVIENKFFGKVLFLDGLIMTTEKDEFFYHEMITHPALVTHPAPKEILIIGGGDGGALKEVLRYSIEKVILVEIDQKVIEVSKKFFPQLAFSFEDERVEIIFADGADYVKSSDRHFDIVIIDSSDPVGPAKVLFRKEFFKILKHRLNQNGIIVAQTESPFYHLETIKELSSIFREIFSIVKFYTCPVPTYPAGFWSFVFLSENIDPFQIRREPPSSLKYFNLEIHRAAFSLPNFLKQALD
ncbi:MAG: polyamine aminopropyltransferase [Candidatus Aminicenantia bacterium]